MTDYNLAKKINNEAYNNSLNSINNIIDINDDNIKGINREYK